MDLILAKYELDIQDIKKQLAEVRLVLGLTEQAGEKAFNDIGGAADNAAKKVTGFGRAAGGAKQNLTGMQNSVNQITRELPAFTMNLNTGFLAISNNLPILIDQINNLKAANAQLAAQGQSTVSVARQIATAFFSWQTALSVGITLLTIYGGKIIDFITGTAEAKKKEEELAKATESQNEALKKQGDEIERILRLRGLEAESREGVEKEITQIENEQIKRKQEQFASFQKERLELEKRFGKSYAKLVKEGNEEALEIYRRYEREEILTTQNAEQKKTDAINKEAEKRKKEADEIEKERIADFNKRIEFEKGLNKLRDDGLAQNLKDTTEEAKKRQEEDKRKFDAFMLGLSEHATQAEIDLVKESEAQKRKEYEDTAKARSEVQSLLIQATIAQNRAQTEQDKKDADQRRKDNIESAKLTAQGLADITATFYAFSGSSSTAFADFQKAMAIGNIAVKTAESIANVIQIATAPTPDNLASGGFLIPAKIIAGIAAVFANIGSAYAILNSSSTPNAPQFTIPAFAEGVVDFQGRGTSTSDSNLVRISKHESVINAKSTLAKKEDLLHLNTSVADYERWLNIKYVEPEIQKERAKNAEFADNVARSIAFHNHANNRDVVKAIKDNKPATKKDIYHLAAVIEKGNRENSFKGRYKLK